MTKQERKQVIKERAVAKKVKAPPEQSAFDEAKSTAYRLENEGKWDEARIAWSVAADCATSTKDKKTAAGRQAAAKVRASAASKAMEEQVAREEAEDQAGATEEALKADREEEAKSLDDQLAASSTAASNAASWDQAMPGPDYVSPENEESEDESDDGDEDDEAPAAADETRPATPEEMAAEVAEQKDLKAKKERAPKESKKSTSNPRMPAVGTVLVKKDRQGAERVRCTIVEGGVEYAGATYKTLSAAGLKAMADLKLVAKTCDGYAFWGLKEGDAPAAKGVDPDRLEAAWDRYRALAERAATEEAAAPRVAAHLESLRRVVEKKT